MWSKTGSTRSTGQLVSRRSDVSLSQCRLARGRDYDARSSSNVNSGEPRDGTSWSCGRCPRGGLAVSREPIPQDAALYLQLAAIAGDEPPSSYLEIRCLRPDGAPGPREFVGVRDLKRAVAHVLGLQDVNVYVGGAPRVRESGRVADVERVWCLWADCDSAEAVEALRRFKPWPSIAVRTSPSRMQALWAIGRPVTPAAARRANRRIAHALGADMAATDAARILRAIGTFNIK